MFSTLRARLLLSYLIIILVCLVLAALTLILVARPIQQRLVLARLSAQATLIVPRVQNLLGRGLSPQQIAEQLQTLAARRGARVLLLSDQGRILGDTADEWTGQAVEGLARNSNGQPRSSGVLTGPDGSNQLYVGGVAGQDQTGAPVWAAAVAPFLRTPAAVLGELGQGLLVAGLVALVLSALLAVLIARSVAKPLHQMARAAEAIAAQDYDQNLNLRGPEEVRVLADSLQAMAQQVKASQQAMRDLVANVSHDLKTPLTSIQGFAQALLEGATQDETARQRAAAVIYEEAGRMVRMVEELLDLARIESGQMSLQRGPLDLRALLDRVVGTLAPVAARKQVTLHMDLPELPWVVGDDDRLAQVFTNLLDNALKYTTAGDRIQVTAQVVKGGIPSRRSGLLARPDDSTLVSLGDEWVEVSVADTGRGIAAEDLLRAFERFYQADKARAGRRGSGLGLAIAQQIIEAHGGHIQVESVEGLGTRFTLVLPVNAKQ
jgi:two-component system OmpR family sensor kinase